MGIILGLILSSMKRNGEILCPLLLAMIGVHIIFFLQEKDSSRPELA